MFRTPKVSPEDETAFTWFSEMHLQGSRWEVIDVDDISESENIVFMVKRPMLFARALGLVMDDLWGDIANMNIPGEPEDYENCDFIKLLTLGFRSAQEIAMEKVSAITRLDE